MADEPSVAYDRHAFCTERDPAPLVRTLEHYAAGPPRGTSLSPLVLEPEPAGVRKRRFRSDIEDRSGFVAQFHFEPMRGGSVAGAISLDMPEPRTADELRSILDGTSGVGVPDGWELDQELLEAGLVALNTAAVADGTSGPWAIAALSALGAPVPTGRWRFILPTLPRADTTM